MIPLRFENVSKKYRQHHEHAADSDLWALNDVSFECKQGEVLGIIGRNGCGKSTILKMAAGVTVPTSGKVTTVKPIAPMLELGAGFHPDLTGRDNIYLNGSLLGMDRKVTRAQFDEIVAFAELESHIDTPVKHYSTGMSARLGFAIAVHSTAPLLLVDEVLSVGDRLFQQKCLMRMMQLRDNGTTIVLVSHDDALIRTFYTRALLFESGKLIADTTPDDALRQYYLHLYRPALTSGYEASISDVRVLGLDESGIGTQMGIMHGASLQVHIAYDVRDAQSDWILSVRVRREDGIYPARAIVTPPHGANRCTVELHDLYIVPGRYLVEVSLVDAVSLTTHATQVSSIFAVPGHGDSKWDYHGTVRVRSNWKFSP
jgi:ABC-type polysaccharide/polyol phosphate transport system ATPase subunit